MAAFDRIRSGIDGMDALPDNIRLGDNVVWQISELEEFRAFARPFARQAILDGRKVKAGQLLMKFDVASIRKAGYNVITPVVVTNHDSFTITKGTAGAVAHGKAILNVTKEG